MPTISKLFLPQTQLSACLFGAFFRDTRGAALSSDDRMNHFPASPLVTVTKVLSGALFLLPEGADWRALSDENPLPEISAMGPKNAPTSSWASGDIAAITVGFYYDAWIALGGDAECRTIPESIALAMQSFQTEGDTEIEWATFCDVLAPHWQATRSKAWTGPATIESWVKSVVTRAALSKPGRSMRSLERRIKRASGQTQRSLDFYASFENLHRITVQQPDASNAEIAIDAGYADQSHMGRIVRRATGFSPSRLNQAIETKEAFWSYRLLGERF